MNSYLQTKQNNDKSLVLYEHLRVTCVYALHAVYAFCCIRFPEYKHFIIVCITVGVFLVLKYYYDM